MPGTNFAQQIAETKNDIDKYVNDHIRSTHNPFADWQELLSGLEVIAEKQLERILASVSDDTRADELTRTIKERRDKLPLRTGYLDGILSTCGLILTFGAAGVALAVGFADKLAALTAAVQHLLYILGVFYAELVLLSLVIIVMYLAQARFRYPFIYLRKIGNAWPWFYYASISDDVSRSLFQLKSVKFRDAGTYAKDLLEFADRCVGETKSQRLRNEIQQYFLLMAYSGYAHQFGLRLANLFIYGLTGAAVSSALLYFVIR